MLHFLHQKMCLLLYLFPIYFVIEYIKVLVKFSTNIYGLPAASENTFAFQQGCFELFGTSFKASPCTELCCIELRADCQFINISVSKEQNCFIFLYQTELKARKSAIDLERMAECALH